MDKTKLTVILAIAAMLAITLPLFLDWRASKAFSRIQPGDPEALVLGYLGGPSKHGSCPSTLMWNEASLGNNDGRCARWNTWLFFRSAYGIGFSKDGKVVAKRKGE
jgi:hypothetical protein